MFFFRAFRAFRGLNLFCLTPVRYLSLEFAEYAEKINI